MLSLRPAGPGDAAAVAALHADSWRRHYRGAYRDAFLDGDVLADRLAVWSARLADPDGTRTVLAEDTGGLAGFVHVVLDHDPRWGSLVDNLHVAHDRQRGGIGRTLLARAGAEIGAGRPVYLWVLEQNERARRFYAALGGSCAGRDVVASQPADRLVGTPVKLRIAWPDAAALQPAG
ncbi:GNAT family N-acetyltransferase [Actinoplanes sp. NPDC024001]|uniref:GNAT family N-acetyltransferase n=1 Tax=Actinoplanes sp. NPDC024001 TaxID=3154598 RepID=UPI0033EE7DB3